LAWTRGVRLKFYARNLLINPRVVINFSASSFTAIAIWRFVNRSRQKHINFFLL
jgi:hypothetical protein